MRVLMVGTDRVPLPSSYGEGIEIHCWSLSKELARLGIEVHLLTLPMDGHSSEEIIENVIIHRVGLRAFDKLFPFSASISYNGFIVAKGLSNLKFDLIHCHNTPPGALMLIVKYLKGSKLIFTKHSLRETMGSMLMSNVEIGVLRKAAKVIAVSNYVKDDLINMGIKKEKIVWVPNGVDTEKFHPLDKDEARERLGIKASKIILFVGAIQRVKGISYIVRSMPQVLEEVPDAVFFIAGDIRDDAYYQELRRMLDKFNVKKSVIFTGPVDVNLLPSYYGACDLLVLPSKSEAFGTVLVEAMACSRPVVATELGAVTEIVTEDYNGFLVKKGDLRKLANSIIVLLKEQKRSSTMGRNGRESVMNKFAWSLIALKTKELYENVITA